MAGKIQKRRVQPRLRHSKRCQSNTAKILRQASKYDATRTFESCIAHAFANKIAFDPKPEKIQILNPIFVPDPTTGKDTPYRDWETDRKSVV